MRWLTLSILSGLLFALGFPTMPFTPLLFVAFVPLLMIEDEISSDNMLKHKGRTIMGFAYITFVIWNIISTFWVANTAFVAGIIAIWLNSWFMTLPVWLFHKTKRAITNKKWIYLSFITYWLTWEYIHLRWEISWTWLNLGNAFSQYPSWIQWYEWTGVFGGSLWILLLNVLLFCVLFYKKESIKDILKNNTKQLTLCGALIIVPIMVSMIWYNFENDNNTKNVEVAIVQPNYEPHYEKFDVPEDIQLKKFISLSTQVLTDTTSFLVFPETSFNGGEIKLLSNSFELRSLKEMISKYPQCALITGIDAYHIFGASEDRDSPYIRVSNRGGEIVEWESYNAAIDIDTSALDSSQVYLKSKLVPGAEFLPYRKIFFFLKPLVEKLGGSLSGLAMQQERSIFKHKNVGVAPIICYESVYGEYVTGYVKNGANLLFIMTNDGWWDNTPGHLQHLQFASLRAIENRRWIARSANTGISCFVNSRGDILKPTKYGMDASEKMNLPIHNEKTLYSKWGDWIGRFGVLFTLLFLLALMRKLIESYLYRKIQL